ncbi:uncharacterized protein LOC111535499 [Piliocolobus tephrosceles]|uniref:uncharacterized protein LOC111535499 n=1 Tax=Piliocolobus tephrosceles TaxID=591936 RepID=UPI000C29ED96|nr:uncharacterized protein LOC111535499 [Piliocolobus tephrosceles]
MRNADYSWERVGLLRPDRRRAFSGPAPGPSRSTLGVLHNKSLLPRRAGSTSGRSADPPPHFRHRRWGVPAAVGCAGRVGWRLADAVIAPKADGHQALPPPPEVSPQRRGMGVGGSSVLSAFAAFPHHRDVGLHRPSPPALFRSAG